MEIERSIIEGFYLFEKEGKELLSRIAQSTCNPARQEARELLARFAGSAFTYPTPIEQMDTNFRMGQITEETFEAIKQIPFEGFTTPGRFIGREEHAGGGTISPSGGPGGLYAGEW